MTTSGQLNDLLKSGSPYLELARSQALQASAARGLQNSSLAAGAGESAVISAAEPIAAADASTYAANQAQNLQTINAFGQQKSQGEINKALQTQAEAANINQILTQGSVNQQLQASANAFSAFLNDVNNKQQITLANVNFQNQLALTVTSGQINSALSAQNAKQQIDQINQTSTDTINQIDAQAKATGSLYGPQLQAQYLQAVSTIMNATATQIAQIYSTQGLTSEQQQNAVALANQQMITNINNLAAFYKSSPVWNSSPSNPNGTPPTGTPPTTPGGPGSTPYQPPPPKPNIPPPGTYGGQPPPPPPVIPPYTNPFTQPQPGTPG